jgi:hypothetical protein
MGRGLSHANQPPPHMFTLTSTPASFNVGVGSCGGGLRDLSVRALRWVGAC